MSVRAIYERRKRNLRLVIDQQFDGTERALARHLGVSPSVINRLFKPYGDPEGRNIGDQKAAEYEVKCGLTPGWLDQERGRAEERPSQVTRQSAMILKADEVYPYVVQGKAPENPEFLAVPEGLSGPRAYYIVMNADTMLNPTPTPDLPSFPADLHVLVDPDEVGVAGDFVVVRFPGSEYSVLRLLEISDSGRRMLTVLNPEHKALENQEQPKGAALLGVAVAQHVRLRRSRPPNN